MDQMIYTTPEYTTGEEIKRVRKALGLTQKEFAYLVHASKPTVERWEAGDKNIEGPIVLLLQMLEAHPEYVQEISVPKQEYPVRVWYMHKNKLCTLIDVDDARKKVKIINYTNHIQFRAFGAVEDPDYQMYLEFLESRCFPEGRDKMKLILKDLNLPFYDPFLIIEKTEGRMAEDDFRLRIERYAHGRLI